MADERDGGDPAIQRSGNGLRLPTGDGSKFAVYISRDGTEGLTVEINGCQLRSAAAVDTVIALLIALKAFLPAVDNG